MVDEDDGLTISGEEDFIRNLFADALLAEPVESDSLEPPEWLEEGDFPYRIIKFVGRGGAGFVWKAAEKEGTKIVALKLVAFRGDLDQARLGWLREAGLTAKCEHPNLIKTYAHGLAPDGLAGWLALEWIEGSCLRGILRERKSLPWAEAREFAFQAFRGLEALHAQGMIHRDIKPGNLLVERETGRLVVCDLGILIPVGEGWLVQTQDAPFTPGYAAPEQILDPQNLDARTDQFSLAATIWEMLSGELPLGDFRSFPASAPPGIEPVLRRALATKPSERFPDLLTFRLALARAQGRGYRWLRRAVPVVLAALIVFLSWLAFRKPPPPPEFEYPRQFQSERLRVLPERDGFATMEATVLENGGIEIALEMTNEELLLGQTTIAEVSFLDAQGVVLKRIVSNPFGVNGRLIPGFPAHRTEHFQDQLPLEFLPRLEEVRFSVSPGKFRSEDRTEALKRDLKRDLNDLREGKLPGWMKKK